MASSAAETPASAAVSRGPERIIVKWAAPADEVLGMAKLAGALVDGKIARPESVAIAVPNRVWAANALSACASLGVKACSCIPQPEDGRVGAVLAKLTAAAREGSALRGLTLARKAGADEIPELACALSHMDGTEDAARLAELVRRQCAHPTVPPGSTWIPVVLMQDAACGADYLLMVGCVDGLMPGPAAFEGCAREREAALERDRAVFAAAVASGSVRTVVSYFARMPEEAARSLGVRYARTVTVDGVRLAVTRPCRFMSETGSLRPTTTGGQALLRSYGLN